MPLVETLVAGPFALSALHLHWHSPAAAPSPAAAARIAARWQEYRAQAAQQQATLFNGPVVQALAWADEPASDGLRHLHLHVAESDYQTFVVTVLRDREWFTAHAPEAMAPVLGNSILLTHRGQALLGMRSAKVSAYPNVAHLFGGVFDIVRPVGADDDPTALRKHLEKELKEEAGLGPQELATEPRVLGLLRDPALLQPELVWQAELAVDPHGWARHPPDEEHTRLLAIPLEALCAGAGPAITPVAWEACRLTCMESAKNS